MARTAADGQRSKHSGDEHTMTSTRNLFLAAAAVFLAASLPCAAQPYPSKPVHVLVPASPGTAIDVTTRFFSERLSKRLGVSVVVENRKGPAALSDYAAASRTPPDGYNLVFAGITLYATPHVSETPVGFDPVRISSRSDATTARRSRSSCRPASPYKTPAGPGATR